jgi:predicted phosphodiesterase
MFYIIVKSTQEGIVRYAVVSDIHANMQAWNAVLTDIATQRIDRILCLGDTVGYGPNPSEVLASLYRHVDGFCMGNHDAVVCGKLDAGLFNDHARQMIEWTRGHLSDKAIRFLARQPLTIAGSGFRCTHGDFTEPAAFLYIEDAASAAPSWQAAAEPLLFFGHTHVPALFVIGQSGTTHVLEPQSFVLEPGKRYLVNPGSTGNPRSGDALATYCIYDSDAENGEGTVCWQTVPFDLDACRAAIRAAGLDEADTGFLALDPRRHLTVVREAVDFAPARNATEQAQGVKAVSELAQLSRTARRWKRAAMAAILIGAVSAAAAMGFALLRPVATAGPLLLPSEDLPAAMPVAARGNWLPDFPSATDGQALPGWRVRLDNPDATTLSIQADEGAPPALTITIRGDTPARFRIESVPVQVSRTGPGRFTVRSRLVRAEGFSGFVRFGVEQLDSSEAGGYTVRQSEVRDPPPVSPHIRFTTDGSKIVADARFVRVVIEGEYSGTATIGAPSLTPAD